VFDQFAENVKAEAGGLVIADGLIGACGLSLIVLFEVRAINLLPVHTGCNVISGRPERATDHGHGQQCGHCQGRGFMLCEVQVVLLAG